MGGGRRKDHQQRIGRLADGLGERRDRRSHADLRPPGNHEVAVHRYARRCGVEHIEIGRRRTHEHAVCRGAVRDVRGGARGAPSGSLLANGAQLVGTAAEPFEWHAGREHRVNVCLVPRGAARAGRHFRVRRQWFRRGRRGHCVLALWRVRRAVARRQRQRHAKAELAGVVTRRLQVFDRDVDVLAGRDVRDGGREQVRARLPHEARALPGDARFAVDALGRVPLVDLALDHALADLHGKAIDGGVVRERQHVHGLHVARAAVAEPLCYAHARHDARDGQPKVRLEGSRGGKRAVCVLEQQRRRADVRRKLGRAGGLRRQRRVEQQPGGEHQQHEGPSFELFANARAERFAPQTLQLAHR